MMRNWWSGIILALGASVPDSISGFRRLFARLTNRRRFAIDDWREKGPLDLQLYGVTDPDCNKRHSRSNAAAVQAAISGGLTAVQLREKQADGAHFCREAQAVIDVARLHGVYSQSQSESKVSCKSSYSHSDLCKCNSIVEGQAYSQATERLIDAEAIRIGCVTSREMWSLQVKVLINDRIDVALATDADGVHVGQDDIPAAVARRLLGSSKILGVSVKTVEQARLAERAGADYLGAGASEALFASCFAQQHSLNLLMS